MDDQNRERLLKLRLNDAERSALIKVAISKGMTPSEWLRQFIHQNAPR
jgi:hypothetical protein